MQIMQVLGSVLYRFYLLDGSDCLCTKHAAGQKKDLFEIKPTELMRIAQSLHDTVELAVSQIQCLMTDGFVRRLQVPQTYCDGPEDTLKTLSGPDLSP